MLYGVCALQKGQFRKLAGLACKGLEELQAGVEESRQLGELST